MGRERRAASEAGIEVVPIAGALGAELYGVDLSQPPDEVPFAAIHQAFLDHLVIFLPGQRITPEVHRDFAALFGEIDNAPFAGPFRPPPVEGHPEIYNMIKEADDRTINVGGLWHADVTHRERPHLGAVIHAIETPTVGGDTLYANQDLAYEALSEGMREMLDGLSAVHSSAMPYGRGAARSGAVARDHAPREADSPLWPDADNYTEGGAVVETTHPVVRTHPETGRKSLFVNRGFTSRFADMTEQESAGLLEFLWDHTIRPEFTARYRWQSGTLGVWDNRCTLHYALNDYYGQRRHMHRISINGDRPR